jgi:hypothetical protein
VRITLVGGAQAKKYFGKPLAVTLGTTSHFEGNILSQTGINFKTGASINGRMLCKLQLRYKMNTVTRP